ncbi:hypothetical protein ASD78_06515 [Lysobacter sp. Root667]|uniref:hypothetical protein n=1 Tax=Lysobacter sp. Root667 TaxID=1736581 RepID=UPI0006F84755|nr:hypothetical protein [Lysobacter sp. Root667]KRA77235.1 hypothetical protein ASD78_06515 [Lysobacter sp. Root667]
MAAALHRLRIGEAVAEDRIDGRPQRWAVTELFIDERPLCQWLGIARDLRRHGTDLDPELPLPERELGRDAFLGRIPAPNQFGSGRLVLYRCHCGSDYCGVISCRLETDGDHVLWQDVTHEDDDGPLAGHNAADSSAPELTPVARFVFDRAQYEQELERHFPR